MTDPFAQSKLSAEDREIFCTGVLHQKTKALAARVPTRHELTWTELEELQEEIAETLRRTEAYRDDLRKPHEKKGPWRKATKAQLKELDERGQRLAGYEQVTADELARLKHLMWVHMMNLSAADERAMGLR
ncbi:hypothetical protein [Roseovarius indicus]|uniref:hypothetical protein n=1 Tax=Roseovarius indicus TaxID=540747 RepID=UPI0040598BDD